MMNLNFLAPVSGIAAILLLSCTNGNVEKYCGFEMSAAEVYAISEWSAKNPDVYDVKNGSEIYAEINDSIRTALPDSVEFEIFLVKLTKKEVCIDIYAPKNEHYFEKLACKLMNTNFSKIVPSQRKIRIYSYANADGSGDSPFETAVKSHI